MAHQSMRVNLASIVFPFATELWGRSIIVPEIDQNYQRTLASSSDIGKDKGIPIGFYMHNVMPTTEGYQSVSYNTNVVGDGVSTDFDRCFPLLETAPQDAHFLFSPSNGKNRVLDLTVNASWVSVSPLAPGIIADNTTVTTAYVQGQTYIYYANLGCYVYDQVAKVMTLTALGGLSASQVIGITASFGYMIAFNASTVAWSNATNPVDFIPSLVTGAGGGSVNDIKGNIVCCIPITGGFLVFCEKNVVSAKYTGNIRFPFIFKEITGSGGISSADQIAVNSNVAEIYAWTSAGLQMFTINGAENIFPDCTDFLAKLIFEDFDETTLLFTEQKLSTPLNIKIAIVGDRFIVISYGVNSPTFTHAIIHDLTLKRWGKVKINHRCAFQWNSPNLFGSITYGQLGSANLTYGGLAGITYGQLLTSANTPELPLKTIAFLQADGTVKTVVFDLGLTTTTGGVFVLGKFQMKRNRNIVHQLQDIENVDAAATFNMYVLPSIDGKTLLPAVKGQRISLSTKSQRWGKRVSGLNVSFLYIGTFNLTSIIADFTDGGDAF